MPRTQSGNGLCFIDDDDLLVKGALSVVRQAYTTHPDQMHIFRMRYAGNFIWTEPVVRLGNVSSQMVCVPRAQALYAKWGDRYEGDYDFIRAVYDKFGEPAWHEETIIVHNGLV